MITFQESAHVKYKYRIASFFARMLFMKIFEGKKCLAKIIRMISIATPQNMAHAIWVGLESIDLYGTTG